MNACTVLEALGYALIAYAVMDLAGVNPAYIIRYLLSDEVRRRRRCVREFIDAVLEDRLKLVLKVLGVRSYLPVPKVMLNLRESRDPGGKYVKVFKAVMLDVPTSPPDVLPVLDHELVHYVQDVLGVRGPKWFVEGMAAYVELLIHGRVRGYRRELSRFLRSSS